MAARASRPADPGSSPANMSPRSAQAKQAHPGGPILAAISPRSAQPARDRSDRALRELARDQHGVLTVGQIEAAGLSPRAARDRAAVGRLRRVHTGIYALDRLDERGRWMAAVLACGAGAILSHRSAAALWGLCEDRGPVDVSVPGRAGRGRTGIAVHRADTLRPSDLAVHERIPCTNPACSLMDLAAVADRRTVERAVDRAEALRRFDLHALRELLQRNPRRRGRRVVEDILDQYESPTTTRSEVEERMLALIAAADLPRPRVNAWIPLDGNTGYEADFLWPDSRLVVEVDGRAHHARRGAFVHDRRRDRRLALAGYETRRYAAGELDSRPREVAGELRRFLEREPGSIAA